MNSNSIALENITIRSDLRPGDVGYLTYMHGWIYAKESGYNHIFEGYVCKTFFDFLIAYDSEKDRIWFAEHNGEMVGAIAVVGHSESRAQLRWFILHPDYRGIGLGGKLFKGAMEYSINKGYKQLFLYTTDRQELAVRMYVNAGFVKIAEHEHSDWGMKLVEETYELNL